MSVTAGKHRLTGFKTLSGGLAVLGLAMCPLAASAASFSSDNWTVDISGFANAYYTTVACNGATIGGTALAGKTLGCGGEQNRTTIGNGWLPNGLTTKFSTQQEGIDIAAQMGLMVHIATADGLSANNGIDVRQAFFTLGTPDFGTVKLGLSGGVSRNQDNLASTAHFKSNSNVTAGAYYALTRSVTLDLELSQTRSKGFAGNTAHMNGVALGGILFF